MSATAKRPPEFDPNPMVGERLQWMHREGVWLGLPPDTSDETIARAFAALEWLCAPPANNPRSA